ncbi:hypothetical protein Gotri_002257 [Gossypium trilobum]|uniref:Ervatamin-B-like n=1 Tax=Gossypium trilobum TaxID=34281 RepID=A0A7J9F8N8_9ROSI|nr:hypothetical protein [Gossypium trilobum]
MENPSFTLLLVCALCMSSVVQCKYNCPEKYDPHDMQERYQRWVARHGRKYKSKNEWTLRFGIYKSNSQFIDCVNSQNLSFKLTDNEFADMTNDEFRAMYLGYQSIRSPCESNSKGFAYDKHHNLPKSIDWRKKGAVAPIKNQGQCGSCWAFSAVAAVEGINQIKTGNLTSLSEQELIDCDTDSFDQGCNGGHMVQAYEFIIKNGGITTEKDYPYTGRDDTCKRAQAKNHAVTISGYKRLPTNNETALQIAVSQQPVSVAIDAAGLEFQFYFGGVFTGDCGNELDHGVAIVGYGEVLNKKYWIVKNSWGTEWGEAGYVRMERGVSDKRGLCGIAMDTSYPVKK